MKVEEKQKTVKYFICEGCGAKYFSAEQAEGCEREHIDFERKKNLCKPGDWVFLEDGCHRPGPHKVLGVEVLDYEKDVLLKVSTPLATKPSGLYQSYARAGKVTRVVTQQQAKSLLDKVKLWVNRLNKDYPDKAFAVQYQHNNPDAFVEIRCAINLEETSATQPKTTNPPQFFCEACLMSFDDDHVREVHEKVCRQIYDPSNKENHK